MGKNCEEKGSLLLPSAAVIPLRNALVEAINKQRQEWIDLAVKVHEFLKSDKGEAERKTLSKLLRGKPVAGQSSYYSADDFVAELAQKLGNKPSRGFYDRLDNDENYNSERNDKVARLLVTPRTPDGAPRKIQSPKKKDLPLLLQSKTWSFGNGVCSVAIDPKTRVMKWSVSEGKNAVDEAWESLLGRTLHRELNKITWTRGTGGAFNYTDEYASDGALEHGYNPISISRSFGPLGEQERDHRSGIPMRYLRKKK